MKGQDGQDPTAREGFSSAKTIGCVDILCDKASWFVVHNASSFGPADATSCWSALLQMPLKLFRIAEDSHDAKTAFHQRGGATSGHQ